MSPRYRYTTRQLTREESEERHRAEIACAKARLDESEADYQWVVDQPPAMEIEVQEEVLPGEPGYDELPEGFSPSRFQGSFQWIEQVKSG